MPRAAHRIVTVLLADGFARKGPVAIFNIWLLVTRSGVGSRLEITPQKTGFNSGIFPAKFVTLSFF